MCADKRQPLSLPRPFFHQAKYNIMHSETMLKFYVHFLYINQIDLESRVRGKIIPHCPKFKKQTNKQTKQIKKKEKRKKQQTLNIPFHKLDNICFLFMLNYNIFLSFCQKKWGRGKHIARFHNVNARKKLSMGNIYIKASQFISQDILLHKSIYVHYSSYYYTLITHACSIM